MVEDHQVVRLSVPALSRYVRLARLTAASVGNDAGFDIDGVEDLRIAVDELFALLVEGAEDAEAVVELVFGMDGGDVTVEGTRSGATPVHGPEHLAQEILKVVVDEHSFEHDGTARRFRLRKKVAVAG
ncbi:MAG: ATP-binding protein [Acidimicrobiia bacterium]